jgi:hypothetical protein
MEPVLDEQEQTRRRAICADGLGVDQREKSLFRKS